MADTDLDWIRRHLLAVLAQVGLSDADLNVVIVADAPMAALHERYCGAAGTTDVITFDLSEGAGVEGEIYACRDEAQRRAAELGHALREELLLYAVHGLLHLMGHDDHDPEAYRAMHAREDALLTAVGVGPRFERAGGHAP